MRPTFSPGPFAVLLLVLALVGCSAEPPLADLAFTHATVIDVESGALRTDQTLYVRGNRIVSIASTSASRIAPETREIDATGHFVIPGLWDAHVHSAGGVGWHFPLLVAHGVTSVRNMHSTVDSALTLTLDIQRRLREGELLGPRFLANGPIIDGYPPVWPGAVVAWNAERGRALVDSLADAGADFIKVYDNLMPDAYEAILEAARARAIAVDGHVPFLVRAEAAAAAGQRTVEHTTGINIGGSTAADSLRAEFRILLERFPDMGFMEKTVAYFTLVRVASDTRDPQLSAAIARAYAEAGVVAVPTLVTGMDTTELVADAARMALVPARVRAWWTNMAAEGPDPIAAVFEGSDWIAPANTKLMHDAGVRILAGSDIGNPFLVPGLSLHDELRLLVEEAGLSPLDALRSATIEPARTFALDDSLGTIAVDRVADFVLLEANPLEDIRATTAIVGVVLNGRYLDREELDGLLAEAAGQ